MPVYVYDGERNLIVHAVNVDGAVETDVSLFDPDTLHPIPRSLVLQKANFSVSGAGSVAINWGGTPDFPMLFMGGGGPGELNFYRWGGVPNQAIDPTGGILLSTVDFAAGSGYTITMEFTKDPIDDPNMLPPDAITGATAASHAVLQLVTLNWTMPVAPTSTIGARIYRSTVNDFTTATIVGIQAGSPGLAVSFGDNVGKGGIYYYWIVPFNAISDIATIQSLSPVTVNMVSNGDFAAGDTSWTVGVSPGWTFANGIATKTPTTGSAQFGQVIPLVAGRSYTVVYTVSNFTAGLVRCRFLNADGGVVGLVDGTNRSANGTYTETLVAIAGSGQLNFFGNPAFGGSVDNISIKEVIV